MKNGTNETRWARVYNRTMTSGHTMSMLPERPLLFLMDGHALVHRAWHAIQTPLNVQRTGEEVRAVYGFLNTFLRNISDWQPTHCALTFDLPAPTFRHKQFEEYKAQRPPTPPELRAQFDRIRQLAEAFRIPIFEMEGYEADDVLGTLGRQAEEAQIEALILTGDTDTLQLVSPWVRVLLSYSVQKRTVYDEAAVKERYGGLGPAVLPDVKALQGDSSDNIPGVPGIGAKTAIKLVSQFGSIEGIYEGLDEVTPPKLQDTLREHHELALQGKQLTTIVRDVPVRLDLESSRFPRYDRAQVVGLLRELEFFTIVPNIPPSALDTDERAEAEETPRPERPETRYELVDTEEKLENLAKELEAAGSLTFNTLTSSPNAMAAELVGLSFSTAPGRAWYVPVGHTEGPQVPIDRVFERLAPLLESPNVVKTAHSANYDMTVLANHGIGVNNVAFDITLAAHLSGRKAVGLDALALEILHEEMTPISELVGKGRQQLAKAQIPIEKAADYVAAGVDFTQRLVGVFETELEDMGLRDLFDTVEMPLAPVLVRMQLNGAALDSEMLEGMSVELGDRLSKIEAGMYETVGHQFNLNSSQQLSEILFNELRLPPTKRTQKGHSTDASSLEGLKSMLDEGKGEGVDPKAYEVLDQILEYRQLSKIKSTYVDALPALVDAKTGRIHTTYNQTGSATGRVSSNDPNVQNIPVRTELGRRVRKAFVTQDPGQWTLLAADYSQIELRILAHLSEDLALLAAFENSEDIHSATAASVYDVPLDAVTAGMRRIAKIMNFGVVYGLSPFGIRQQTGLSPDDGAVFIDTYFGKYPGIRGYIDSMKSNAAENGYVETVLGRRRYIPEVVSTNRMVRSASERMAINMPIQGTAADIIKIAMVRIQERLDALALRSMMIFQVHDELIFEVPHDELEQMRAIVMEMMPSALTLKAPLAVELKTGPTWGDME